MTEPSEAVESGPARPISIDGRPGREYRYLRKAGTPFEIAAVLRVYVGTGLPRLYKLTFKNGEQLVQEFYDYGAFIDIRLPRCR